MLCALCSTKFLIVASIFHSMQISLIWFGLEYIQTSLAFLPCAAIVLFDAKYYTFRLNTRSPGSYQKYSCVHTKLQLEIVIRGADDMMTICQFIFEVLFKMSEFMLLLWRLS